MLVRSDLLRTSYSIFEIWTADILSGCLLPVSVAPLISLYQFLIGLVIQLETQLLPSSAPTSAMAVFMLFSPTNYFPLKSSKGGRSVSHSDVFKITVITDTPDSQVESFFISLSALNLEQRAKN